MVKYSRKPLKITYIDSDSDILYNWRDTFWTFYFRRMKYSTKICPTEKWSGVACLKENGDAVGDDI